MIEMKHGERIKRRERCFEMRNPNFLMIFLKTIVSAIS
jgi:hypothetical protein